MRAVVQDRYGEAEVLQLREVERPRPGADEVLVRVRAAGVDPGVWHLMAGLPHPVRLASGLRTPRNPVRGLDAAGVVEEVGPNVTAFRPGDEVFGVCEGSFAEYALARPGRLAPKPTGLTFEQAAALPISGCTALQALRDTGGLRAGQHVLVIGAAGGVGSYAVQVAKLLGAEVTGVCSTGKTELVRSLGADRVLDYTREEITEGGYRYDLVLDTAGNRPLSLLRQVLTPRGTLVIVGGEGGSGWLGGLDRQLRAVALSPFVGQRLRTLVAQARTADLRHLAEAAEQGRLVPVLDRGYPLDRAADAVRHVHAGHARGKVVLTV
ncbi:NAD(P)-dependent alcohol dehydrogenase [Kitasatospora sp. NPDC085895]|uniref:NAD(P)-dependent alcohol dehydrogenase n=1 Tax=Kitasatospora sp. NPDC085895 TaxID=3155057 RepID=UPI00344CBAEF